MVLAITCIFKLARVFPYLRQLKLLQQQVRKYLSGPQFSGRVKYLSSLEITLPRCVQREEQAARPQTPYQLHCSKRKSPRQAGKYQWALTYPVSGQDNAPSEEQVKSSVQRRPVHVQRRVPDPGAGPPRLFVKSPNPSGLEAPFLYSSFLTSNLLGEGVENMVIKGLSPLPCPFLPISPPLLLPLHSYIPQVLTLCTSPPSALGFPHTHLPSCHRSAG